MKITITKCDRRNELACWRDDGTCERADLGPSLPHHDLAHFVVEQGLNLQDGFFGRIARGFSVAQLGNKDVIMNAPPESLAAEVVARALQSLSSGASRLDQVVELVNWELSRFRISPVAVDPERWSQMLTEFQGLIDRYEALAPREMLQLEFQTQRRL